MDLAIDKAPPRAEDLELAKNELRETAENVQVGLAELRELLKADNTIYFKDDDETLTVFLRPCKWYAKSAYELMKRAADFKEKHKDILKDLTPDCEKEALTQHNIVNVLKERDQKGRRILLVRSGANWDPSKVASTQIFRMFYLIHELATLEPQTQINGIIAVMDYKDLGLKQVKGLGPSYAKLLLTFIQEAMPLRLKEVHFVLEPSIFSMVWTIFKPLIKPKLKARIFFHGSKMESLHKHLDPATLPVDYGGQLPAINYSGKDWYPIMMQEIDHFKTWNTFGRK